MKIVITKKDVDEAGEFDSIINCPLAKVMQRELNDPSITVGEKSIGDWSDSKKRYATIDPPFSFIDYERLRKGEIEEFVTEYTPL